MLYFFFLYALLRYFDDNNTIWHVFFIFYMFGISRVVEIKLIYIYNFVIIYYYDHHHYYLHLFIYLLILSLRSCMQLF
jgi:hypothetical protein